MTPCRSGRPGNREGTVTPSAGDVTRHGTKPGKKRPTRRRAGPKGSCVTPYRIPVASLSNTKIVPSPQTNNSDPNYSDRNCQKIRFLKDRNVIRCSSGLTSSLFKGFNRMSFHHPLRTDRPEPADHKESGSAPRIRPAPGRSGEQKRRSNRAAELPGEGLREEGPAKEAGQTSDGATGQPVKVRRGCRLTVPGRG